MKRQFWDVNSSVVICLLSYLSPKLVNCTVMMFHLFDIEEKLKLIEAELLRRKNQGSAAQCSTLHVTQNTAQCVFSFCLHFAFTFRGIEGNFVS